MEADARGTHATWSGGGSDSDGAASRPPRRRRTSTHAKHDFGDPLKRRRHTSMDRHDVASTSSSTLVNEDDAASVSSGTVRMQRRPPKATMAALSPPRPSSRASDSTARPPPDDTSNDEGEPQPRVRRVPHLSTLLVAHPRPPPPVEESKGDLEEDEESPPLRFGRTKRSTPLAGRLDSYISERGADDVVERTTLRNDASTSSLPTTTASSRVASLFDKLLAEPTFQPIRQPTLQQPKVALKLHRPVSKSPPKPLPSSSSTVPSPSSQDSHPSRRRRRVTFQGDAEVVESFVHRPSVSNGKGKQVVRESKQPLTLDPSNLSGTASLPKSGWRTGSFFTPRIPVPSHDVVSSESDNPEMDRPDTPPEGTGDMEKYFTPTRENDKDDEIVTLPLSSKSNPLLPSTSTPGNFLNVPKNKTILKVSQLLRNSPSPLVPGAWKTPTPAPGGLNHSVVSLWGSVAGKTPHPPGRFIQSSPTSTTQRRSQPVVVGNDDELVRPRQTSTPPASPPKLIHRRTLKTEEEEVGSSRTVGKVNELISELVDAVRELDDDRTRRKILSDLSTNSSSSSPNLNVPTKLIELSRTCQGSEEVRRSMVEQLEQLDVKDDQLSQRLSDIRISVEKLSGQVVNAVKLGVKEEVSQSRSWIWFVFVVELCLVWCIMSFASLRSLNSIQTIYFDPLHDISIHHHPLDLSNSVLTSSLSIFSDLSSSSSSSRVVNLVSWFCSPFLNQYTFPHGTVNVMNPADPLHQAVTTIAKKLYTPT